MKLIHGFCLVFLYLFCLNAGADFQAIPLAIGEQKSFPVDAGTRYSLGNPEVIQVKVAHSGGGSLLLVKGKSQGYSDLLLISDSAPQKSLAFRVVSKKQQALATEGGQAFSASSSLKMSAQGDGWLIRGEAKSLEDWNLAQSMESQAKGKVQKIVRLHPLERLKAEDLIRRRFQLAGLTHFSVQGVGNSILLVGDAKSSAEKEYAEGLAKEVFLGARSHIRVPFEGGGRLRYKAKIIEVLRSGAEELGVNWSDTIQNVLQVSNHFIKGQFSLEAGLKFLEKRGQAKTLSQPELLLNEKGVAELKVGGEIPIPLKTKNTSNIIWKPYGLTLRLELPGISGQTARTHIIVELSSLDQNSANDGVPGIRLSRMETQVDMAIGRPILLSGLTESRNIRDLSLFPFLGDIPVLGELFRSQNYQEKKSELVILLEAQN